MLERQGGIYISIQNAAQSTKTNVNLFMERPSSRAPALPGPKERVWVELPDGNLEIASAKY